MEYAGLRTTSWVTDTGEVVREESPLGLITIRETPERARAMAVPIKIQSEPVRHGRDCPITKERIDESRDVRRLRVRLDGVDLSSYEMDGVSQTATTAGSTIVEIRDARTLKAGPPIRRRSSYLAPEPLIESDDPEIVAEAQKAIRGVTGRRAQAEKLTRYVNGLLDKKPTISIPSRAKCCGRKSATATSNRRSSSRWRARPASGAHLRRPRLRSRRLLLPRVARGLHRRGQQRGLWLPVDPTLNEFPWTRRTSASRAAARKQTAILPLVGKLKMTILDLDLAPGSGRFLRARRRRTDLGPLAIPLPSRKACCACPDDAIHDLVKTYGKFTAVDGVSLDVQPGEIHGFSAPTAPARRRRCG